MCTHVAAVMLWRYKAQLEKIREQKLYVCTAQIECASSTVYAKELAEGAERGPLALKARPRGMALAYWGSSTSSRLAERPILCRAYGGSPCRRV
ncbi:MAG: hypothetical protein JZD41_07590 [Thermoproteus sp.]|nr:hypothetical protein [Thermoproteus sp.]